MSKTVTMLADVYPYCLGDVVVLNDEELKAVDAVAKARKQKVYQAGAQPEVDSTAEADRQAAERAAQVDVKEVNARVKLEEEAAVKAEAQGHASPSGKTVAGTSAGTEVKTAAAANKK